MEPLVEINFTGRNGERELLWCSRKGKAEFEVRTPPISVDNVSVGTVVGAVRGDDGELHQTSILSASKGATVRFIAADGIDARDVYRGVVLQFAADHDIKVGPASFVASTCVSFHVGHRDKGSEAVLDLLEELEADGKVRVWEIGDPLSSGGPREVDVNADAVIRHDRPV